MLAPPAGGMLILGDPTEIAPPHRETPVARLLSQVVLQTIAATPPLLSVKMGYRNPKTGLARGGIARKACL